MVCEINLSVKSGEADIFQESTGQRKGELRTETSEVEKHYTLSINCGGITIARSS